jgi:hypothetical protein
MITNSVTTLKPIVADQNKLLQLKNYSDLQFLASTAGL